VADQAEGLDGDPALGGDKHPVLEGVAEVVVRRRPTRVEDAHREDGPVPGQDDEATAVGGERKEVEGHVEIQAGVQKRRVVVMGKGVVIPPEPGDLAQEHPKVFAEKLHERQVHEATGGIPGLG
jgi:hypothetical protein